MRILPPGQISDFITQFDMALREGYENLLGTPIDEIWWEIAKLPPKYGGMGWPTGLHTFGAHYISSLAKTGNALKSLIPSYNPEEIAIRETNHWLHEVGPATIDAKEAFRSVQNIGNHNLPWLEKGLSIAQQCDIWRWKKVRALLTHQELNHVLAHSGSTNWWVTCPPLSWKHWNMPPTE